jgi:ribosomal protein S18 acetylase RimI-like enzyme
MLRIFSAQDVEHHAIARVLFVEYAEQLGHGLEFQQFDRELETLPGPYAPPQGCLLLASDGNDWIGCVALRPQSATICELKRMYIRPAYRRRGIARRMTAEIIRIARQIGYERMRLDTLAPMTPARRLYESMGFRQIEPYYHNPIDGAVFYELDLRGGDV